MNNDLGGFAYVLELRHDLVAQYELIVPDFCYSFERHLDVVDMRKYAIEQGGVAPFVRSTHRTFRRLFLDRIGRRGVMHHPHVDLSRFLAACDHSALYVGNFGQTSQLGIATQESDIESCQPAIAAASKVLNNFAERGMKVL